MSKAYEYTVISSQLSTPSTLVVTLQYDNNQRRTMSYEPGQYAAISFMRNNRPTPARCFSITSPPTSQAILQFAIRVNGTFTKTAQQVLVPGAKVIVEGPFGNFTFNADRDRSVMMMAGGIGVAPYLSMVRYATRLELANEMMLVYSCHTQDDVPFLPEILELKQLNSHFNVVFAVGSGPVDRLVQLNQYAVPGHIDGKLIDALVSRIYTDRTYFICGPPSFMSSLVTTLKTNGAPAESIVTEAFTQGQAGPKALSHNLPLQVYALTGLGLVFGSASVLVGDTASVTPKSAANYTGQSYTAVNTSNSRQSVINQTIANLQSGTAAAQTTQDSTSMLNVPAGTPAPAASPTPTVSPAPSASPSPSPSPSPTPTPGSTPTPTPSPTPSPSPSPPPVLVAPVVRFSASSTTITSGSSTTLTWSINMNATLPVNCTASGGWSGSKSTSGTQSVSPTSTKTYTLTCTNSAGSSTQSITITVKPACISTPSNPC